RGPRLLAVAVATWVAGWLLALLLAPDGAIQGRFDDGGVYYLAGRAFLLGQNYFASPDFRQWPLLAALWAPVALLPPGLAMRAWMLFMLAALIGSVALLLRERDYFRERPAARWLILAVAGPPALDMLYLGQMSGACFAAYATGLALLRRRPVLAGCCFALMAAKPHLVLLALPVLTTAELPAVLAFAGAMLVWPIGSLLVAGPAVFRAFVVQLYAVRDTNVGLVTSSLSSLLPLQGGLHEVVQAGLLLTLLIGCGVLAMRRLRHGRRLPPADVDLATALVLAALPYALVSDLLFLLPLLLRLGPRRNPAAWWPMLAWWTLPWLATLLNTKGGGGLAALLPPLVAVAGWRLFGSGRRDAALPFPLPSLFRRPRLQVAERAAGDLSLQ
ncbi:MAG TPA: glycosyltransferase family 87 protein, partial [Chloroflexota bacterium]|nr:glycosyltransferase family 87 protein [Chloroflexota bacterium]